MLTGFKDADFLLFSNNVLAFIPVSTETDLYPLKRSQVLSILHYIILEIETKIKLPRYPSLNSNNDFQLASINHTILAPSRPL